MKTRENRQSLLSLFTSVGASWIAGTLGLLTLVIAAVGCSHMTKRGQSPDDQVAKIADEGTTRYIEDACRIYGLNFAKVEGIGLVAGLEDTGSNPVPSGQREHLISELKSRGVEEPKELLARKTTSMVVLRGLLPPGIKKGERFDVEVKTLPKSDTQSLEHGYLVHTRMRPMVQLGRGVKQGHLTGYCKGSVLVDALFESRQDQPNQLRGWILGGGVASEDRPLGLILKTDHSVRTTTSIARAINGRFTTVDETGRRGVATPKTDKVIELLVPDEYRHNIGRYLQVIMNLAFDEPTSMRVNRMDQLDQQISVPTLARVAALRLEALGHDGAPALKRALRHHDPEVQFHAAQALAYMGEGDGVSILEEMARTEPAFRWHALTALASLDDIEAGSALANLMHVDSAETRYGAFRAMQARSPEDPLVKGKAMDDFFFHVVPTTGPPMLHLSRSLRPELVCFGADQTVSDDFLFVKTGLTIRSTGKGTVQLARFTRDGEVRQVCSTKISDVVEAMSSLGCDYSTMISMFREAKQADSLDTRLVVNAVPRIGNQQKTPSSEELPLEQSDKYVAGPLPELFRSGDGSERAVRPTDVASPAGANEPKNDAATRTRLSKMKSWLSKDRED